MSAVRTSRENKSLHMAQMSSHLCSWSIVVQVCFGGSKAGSYPWSNAERSPDLHCGSAVPERTLISKAKFPRLFAPTNGTVRRGLQPHHKITHLAGRYHGSEYCSVKLIEGIGMAMRVGLLEKTVSNALDGSLRIWMMLSVCDDNAHSPFSPSRTTRPRLRSVPENSPRTASSPAVNSSLMSFTHRDPRSPEPICPQSSLKSTRSTRHASFLSDSRHCLVAAGAQALL